MDSKVQSVAIATPFIIGKATESMARGEVMGIIIRQETAYLPDHFFWIEIGEYSKKRPDSLFITTPILRRIIKREKLKSGYWLGSMHYSTDSNRKLIISTGIHPLDTYLLRKIKGLLAQKGLSNLIELQIEKYLSERFPGYHITSTNIAERARIEQLRKRFRRPGEHIPIETARNLTREQVIHNFQKHKIKAIAARRVELRRQRKRMA